MARARDRTEDFKDAVRHSARSLGYDEAKLASVMASFIIHKPQQRSPFSKASLKTLQSIGELEQFLLKHKKDYTDLHRTTEKERDSIEHEVSVFIKTCQEQINVLKNSINQEEETSKGWLGITTSKANAGTIAHKHGVFQQFDQLRAVRFQDATNRATTRRKLNRLARKDSTETSKSGNVELKEPDELSSEPLRVQQQLLDDETRAFRWN